MSEDISHSPPINIANPLIRLQIQVGLVADTLDEILNPIRVERSKLPIGNGKQNTSAQGLVNSMVSIFYHE